jgi:hypothetical protein
MNSSTVAKALTSLCLLVAGCSRQPKPDRAPVQPGPAAIRHIEPEELKLILPPRLQGPDGPYSKVSGGSK